jgi:hypothetical protein
MLPGLVLPESNFDAHSDQLQYLKRKDRGTGVAPALAAANPTSVRVGAASFDGLGMYSEQRHGSLKERWVQNTHAIRDRTQVRR